MIGTHNVRLAVGPDEARQLARRILAERRFQPERQPQPLRRPLTWLGRELTDAFGPVLGPVWNQIVRQKAIAGIVASVALAAFVVWLVRLGRGRMQLGADRRLLDAGVDADPAKLEAAADRARAAGHHDLALRLRFKAGLLRLERAGRIGPSQGRTNGDVRRQLDCAPFSELADRFDQVVYGGDEATVDDDDRARRGWREILSENPG